MNQLTIQLSETSLNNNHEYCLQIKMYAKNKKQQIVMHVLITVCFVVSVSYCCITSYPKSYSLSQCLSYQVKLDSWRCFDHYSDAHKSTQLSSTLCTLCMILSFQCTHSIAVCSPHINKSKNTRLSTNPQGMNHTISISDTGVSHMYHLDSFHI